jgi:tetratricopeptide (TPR) repeat protein
MKKPWEGAPFGRLPGAFFCQYNDISVIGRTVSQRPRFRFAILCALLACLFQACLVFAQVPESQKQKLDRQYQSAVSQYEAGQYAEAASQLEELLPHAPNSFAIHELMGLVYASLSQNAKAIEHLQTAVRLQPGSAVARTNLATTLFHAGKASLAGEQFRKALELEPKDFDANHNLGEFYIQSGKIAEACPKLEEAQRIDPSSYDNGYDLALAYFLTGRLAEARKLVQSILPAKNTGELHNLLGQIEEKDEKYIAAANEFETAAHLDPSEDNLFDWGSELLLHRTYEPAIEVFQEATRRYPSSPRLMIGLGMTLDLRGKYDEAVKALLAAADLDPADARCYLFLSKAYDSSPSQAGEVIQRFQRYAELKPNDALAQYYYALSLWKGKRVGDASLDLQAVESLLKKAIALDDKVSEAHVQLGNVYADRHEYEKSIPEYVRALELDPNLSDAHYRLGTDYVHVGQKDRAQEEFDVYQKLRAGHLAEIDKERAEVQQFVYAEKAGPSARH